MTRSFFVFIAACIFSMSIPAQESPATGNSRNYEVDILLDTFAYGADDIDADTDLVFQGCPHRDCIPSIDEPGFSATHEVDYLADDDLILSVTVDGLTRGYPTRILDQHEIVNDWFGETPVAVTFCPLCGSGLAFVRTLDGAAVELGVSGLLHNNDLIMYDRKTKSLWQQITGVAIAGPKRGEALEAIPASMALWSEWKQSHTDAEVLSPVHDISVYVKNQYADYQSSDRLLFPVSREDARLHVKKVIYGVEVGSLSIAVESEWLYKNRSWEHEIEGRQLKLQLDSAQAVIGTLDGQPIAVHRMFWFAWYSFHPNTSLIQ